MTPAPANPPDVASGRGPRFRLLLVGHRPGTRAADTLVLGAIAALNGYRYDGSEMPRSVTADYPGVITHPTLAQVARETGLHRNTVARSAERLAAAGEVCEGVLEVVPEAMAERAALPRQLANYDVALRTSGLGADAMLLVALIRGQARRDRLAMGLGRLGDWIGASRSKVVRILNCAEAQGLLHRWTAPLGRGQLIIGLGVPQGDTRVMPQGDTRMPGQESPTEPSAGAVHQDDTPVPPGDTAVHQDDTGGCPQVNHALRLSDRLSQAVPQARDASRPTDRETEVGAAAREQQQPASVVHGVGVLGSDSPARRRTRLAIAVALGQGRRAAAGRHIRDILGPEPSREALADLLSGIVDPDQARELLEVGA